MLVLAYSQEVLKCGEFLEILCTNEKCEQDLGCSQSPDIEEGDKTQVKERAEIILFSSPLSLAAECSGLIQYQQEFLCWCCTFYMLLAAVGGCWVELLARQVIGFILQLPSAQQLPAACNKHCSSNSEVTAGSSDRQARLCAMWVDKEGVHFH